jgi:hypothetical protein
VIKTTGLLIFLFLVISCRRASRSLGYSDCDSNGEVTSLNLAD